MVLFYAAQALQWWPFQLASLASKRLPATQRPGLYHILVDNGMFAYMKDGSRPDLDK